MKERRGRKTRGKERRNKGEERGLRKRGLGRREPRLLGLREMGANWDVRREGF